MQRPDDTVLHQSAHEEIIDARAGRAIEDKFDEIAQENNGIGDVESAGAEYSQSHTNSMVDAINELRDNLIRAGLMPEEPEE